MTTSVSENRRRPRAWSAVVVTLAVAGGVGVAPAPVARAAAHQAPEVPPRTRMIAQWLAAVEQHVPGEVDAALLGVAALSAEELRAVWSDGQVLIDLVQHPARTKFRVRPLEFEPVPRSGVVPDVTFSPDARVSMAALATRVTTLGLNAMLRRSAMLHTDVITLAPQIAATSTGATSMRAPVWMFIGDGGSLGIESVSLHWQIARMSVGSMTPDPRQVPFVRDWYRAALAHEQGGELFDANQLRFGLRLFPDDPFVLLFAGCQHEAFAGPLFQAFARARRAPGQDAGIKAPAAELAEAEGLFRRALAADPTLAEARIRLGRVLGLRGQPAEAVRELTRALEGPLEPVLEYYGRLFLGAEHHAARRWAEARTAFARAAAVMPRSRVASLALAQVAREEGDRGVVTASLAQALQDLPEDQLSDPWWAYRRAQGRHADVLLTALRRDATRATP